MRRLKKASNTILELHKIFYLSKIGLKSKFKIITKITGCGEIISIAEEPSSSKPFWQSKITKLSIRKNISFQRNKNKQNKPI